MLAEVAEFLRIDPWPPEPGVAVYVALALVAGVVHAADLERQTAAAYALVEAVAQPLQLRVHSSGDSAPHLLEPCRVDLAVLHLHLGWNLVGG